MGDTSKRRLWAQFLPEAVVNEQFVRLDDGRFWFDATEKYLELKRINPSIRFADGGAGAMNTERLLPEGLTDHSGPFTIAIERGIDAYANASADEYARFTAEVAAGEFRSEMESLEPTAGEREFFVKVVYRVRARSEDEALKVIIESESRDRYFYALDDRSVRWRAFWWRLDLAGKVK